MDNTNKNICGNVDGFLKFWLQKQGILFIINTENTWEYKEENNILMYFLLVFFECIIFGCMCIFIKCFSESWACTPRYIYFNIMPYKQLLMSLNIIHRYSF